MIACIIKQQFNSASAMKMKRHHKKESLCIYSELLFMPCAKTVIKINNLKQIVCQEQKN